MVDNRVAPSVTTQPSSKTVKLNERIALSCTATGNPTPNIRWYKDDKAIKGPQAFGNEYVIPEATPHIRGFYQCEAFSSFGKPSRSAVAVTLIQGWHNVLCTPSVAGVQRPQTYFCTLPNLPDQMLVLSHPAGIVQFHVQINFLDRGNTGSRMKRQTSGNIIEAVCC